VTAVPGTTRDTLTEPIDIGGLPVVLTDTAGLRSASDDIETLGIARAQQAMNDADLILLVLDGSAPVSNDDKDLIEQTAGVKRVLVVNKCDLPQLTNGNDLDRSVRVSAKTGAGIEDLRSAILARFQSSGLESGGLLITNARHYDLLRRAKAEL
jgi:tRNA modification GTPase